MTSASWALQQAVFAVLSTSGDVRALAGDRIFDAVPRGVAFPYVVVGDASETAWHTATEDMSEHRFGIRVWSRSGGHKEAKQLAQAVRYTLDGQALTLDGHTLVDLSLLGIEYARERDGITYRATLTFRAVTDAM